VTCPMCGTVVDDTERALLARMCQHVHRLVAT
jgi:hypothetical protein